MADEKQHQFRYTEYWQGRTGLTFAVEDILFSERSDYQQVQVLETDAFGRLMLLDGLVMLTEHDEFVYHEMIAHPALCLLDGDAPRRVLVVGGGDGGTVREVLRHEHVGHVDLVEIDGLVLEASRRFFPTVASALDDDRLTIHVADGVAFVNNAEAGSYDLILVDSTDPVGFAEGLFGEAFYRACARALTARGLLVTQAESPFDPAFHGLIAEAHGVLDRLFAEVHLYLAYVPTYPMGLWSFLIASKALHPLSDFDTAHAAAQLAPFAEALRYYNTDIHRAAFALPTFARRLFAQD